ncbi:MAG: AAA family ATPase [Actinomycetota bacterium]|nr:AAA family ATPase [Actinomycetota bacterium]
MNCPTCGRQNRADAPWCGYCGADLASAPAEATSLTGTPAGSVFIGRVRELTELKKGLEDALRSQGRLLLMLGEAGIGKTRTAEEFARYARIRGAAVLWGPSHESETAPSYWPWVQIIRAAVRDLAPDALREHLGPAAPDITQLVPELSELVPSLPAPPSLEPEQARFRLFDSVTRFLKNLALQSPLLVILDDLHRADKPSLLLLQFLARELKDSRILVVAAYRHTEVATGHPLLDTVGELTAERILLPGLASNEVATLLSELSGVSLPEAFIDTVVHATEGNPFFASEFVRLLASEGRLDQPETLSTLPLAVPQGVREVVTRRLAQLSSDCGTLLTSASAIGVEFSPALLREIAPAGNIDAALDEAVTANLLVELSRPFRYRYAHTLIHQTLYETISTTRRTQLHKEIGDALERLHAMNLEPHLSHLAYHFFEAAETGDVDKAIDYASRAGERALSLYAYEEAAVHFEHALESLDLVDDADDGRRCELLLSLGSAQSRAGDVTNSKATFLRAAEVARQIGSAEHLGLAALGFGGGLEMEGFGVEGRVDDALVGLLEEALGALKPADSPLKVRLLGRLAVALYWGREERERRIELARDAVEMAKRLADPVVMAAAFSSHRNALWRPEAAEERRATATEVIRLAERGGDKERALQGHRWRLMDSLELGDVAGADAEIEAHDRLSRELRQPIYQGYTMMFRAMRAIMRGRFTEGERLAQEAFATGTRVSNPVAPLHFSAQMFWIWWERGQLGSLVPAMENIADQAPPIMAVRCGFAFVLSEVGMLEQAQHELDEIARNDFLDLPGDDLSWLPALTRLVPVCVTLKDKEKAALLHHILLPYVERNIVIGPPPAVFGGPMSFSIGTLEAVLGKTHDAKKHLDDALSQSERMGAKPFAARARLASAEMLHQRGAAGDAERAEIIALASQTRTIADDLGMDQLAERARLLESQVLTNASPVISVTTGSVFRREGDYWTISYDGSVFRMKDAKGLRYLAALLASPGREFHVADLATEPAPGSKERFEPGDGAHADFGDAGDVIDPEARTVYERRVKELRAEIAEAEEWGDAERVSRARVELDAIAHQLSAAFGLGGRARKAGDTGERIRKAVTKRIRDAITKIGAEHASLGQHLANSISTGTFCVYTPEKDVDWTL